MSAECRTITRALWGHFLAAKWYFQCTKQVEKENSPGAKVEYFLILNTAINQKIQKKIRVVGTLKKKKCFFYQISRKNILK